MAGALLFVMHDRLDPAQDPQPERQPGIDPRRLLLDHAGAQHVAMRDDLRLGRVFLEDRQEVAGQTHSGHPWKDTAAERFRDARAEGQGGACRACTGAWHRVAPGRNPDRPAHPGTIALRGPA